MNTKQSRIEKEPSYFKGGSIQIMGLPTRGHARLVLYPSAEHAQLYGAMGYQDWMQEIYSKFRRGPEYGEELNELKDRVDELASGLESVREELSSCKECIDRLYEEFTERPIIKETIIFDIDEDLEVITPLPIVIEESDDEVVASFPEIEVFAVGVGEAEAINNLKIQIKELYLELVATPQGQLGKIPRTWRRILEKVIRKVG